MEAEAKTGLRYLTLWCEKLAVPAFICFANCSLFPPLNAPFCPGTPFTKTLSFVGDDFVLEQVIISDKFSGSGGFLAVHRLWRAKVSALI